MMIMKMMMKRRRLVVVVFMPMNSFEEKVARARENENERERGRRRRNTFFYKKMGQIRPLFSLFSFFSQDKYSPNLTINDKSIDAVLGTRTRGCRIQHFVLILGNYGLLPHSKIALCKFWVNYPTLGLKLTDSRSRVFSPQPLCHGSRPCCTL